MMLNAPTRAPFELETQLHEAGPERCKKDQGIAFREKG